MGEKWKEMATSRLHAADSVKSLADVLIMRIGQIF